MVRCTLKMPVAVASNPGGLPGDVTNCAENLPVIGTGVGNPFVRCPELFPERA